MNSNNRLMCSFDLNDKRLFFFTQKIGLVTISKLTDTYGITFTAYTAYKCTVCTDSSGRYIIICAQQWHALYSMCRKRKVNQKYSMRLLDIDIKHFKHKALHGAGKHRQESHFQNILRTIF